VQRENGEFEKLEQWDSSSDAVDGAEEDKRSTGITEKKVVEVEVLLDDKGGQTQRSQIREWIWDREGSTERTNLFVNHAFDLRLLQSRDDSVLGRKVDDLGLSVTEVQLLEEVLCSER
jgi:hypothetical protein